MPANRPQNPVYTVDARAYDACLPKVVCAHCGAVMSLRTSKEPRRLRCSACGCLNHVIRVNGVWKTLQHSASAPARVMDHQPS